MGDLAAKFAVEELKIQSHKDKVLLAEAKDKCYQAGFAKGVMKVGPVAGMKVELAKVEIK